MAAHRDLGLDPGDGGAAVPRHRRADMIDDPRFRTNTDRVKNIDECDKVVADFIKARTLTKVWQCSRRRKSPPRRSTTSTSSSPTRMFARERS